VPREKEALQQALSALQPEHEQQPTEDGSEAAEGTQAANRFSIAQNGQAGATQPEYELRYDGQAVPMSAELQDLLDSIMQDMGEMAEDYLTPAGGSGAYPLDESGAGGEGHLKDLPSPAGKLWLYPEWDYARARFRDAFCALTEQDVPEGDAHYTDVLWHRIVNHALLDAVLADVAIDQDARLGDVTEQEASRGLRQTDVTRQWVFGLGPAVGGGFDARDPGVSWALGYTFGLTPEFSARAGLDFGSFDHGEKAFWDVNLGGDYFLTEIYPGTFVTVEFGYGRARDVTGFALGGGCELAMMAEFIIA
jgi:hypothetical protein